MKAPGGRYAQKGFAYQNSIAAKLLFELLIGGDGVRAVTLEASEPVDDIFVERAHRPNSYHQIKTLAGVGAWTPSKLVKVGVLTAFSQQLSKTGSECCLVLSSPTPEGPVARWAESVRELASLGEFTQRLPGFSRHRGWKTLAEALVSTEGLFAFLRSYREEQWPEKPSDILALCQARYHGSPYASIPGLWEQLRDIAGLNQ